MLTSTRRTRKTRRFAELGAEPRSVRWSRGRVLHHDYELGGCNDYANTEAHASPWVLRMLSTAHCRRQFPSAFAPYLDALWHERGGRALETIDVGCGALSRLRSGALTGRLRVTGVDPLLDM